MMDRWHVGGTGGLYSQGVTGGDMGAGAINCAELYINGSGTVAVIGSTAPVTINFGDVGLAYDSNFRVTGTGALGLATIGSGLLLGNATGGNAEPGAISLSAFD